MKHTFHYLLMGSAVLVLAACGSSKGPGDIGSKKDIVIRNAGDPAPAAMAASEEAPVDPVIAQHQQAVEEAEPEIEEMAAQDPDNTPVPGDPIEEAKAEPIPETALEAEAVASEEIVETDTAMEETIAEAEEIVAEPMKRTEMVQPEAETVLEPIDTQAHDAAKSAETAVAAAPTPKAMPEAASLPKPVYEGDPAVSNAEAMDAQAEQAETYTPSTGVTSGLIAHPSKGLISALQKALNQKGYYFGAMDGNLGAETLNALHLYQSAHGMSDYGMTVETLEKLGVDASQY